MLKKGSFHGKEAEEEQEGETGGGKTVELEGEGGWGVVTAAHSRLWKLGRRRDREEKNKLLL